LAEDGNLILGKRIKVEISGGREGERVNVVANVSRKIFVANLHDDISEDELS